MAAQQLETASPDKHALATVLSYLKDKQLKETELALKRELGLEKVSVGEGPQTTIISHSGLEPAKYEESYSRLAPLSSTSTKIEFQSACHDDSLEDTEPLSLEMEDDSEPEEEEEDIIAEVSSLQEEKRSYSWPGSLPNHHLKFPQNSFNFNKAQFKAENSLLTKSPQVWAVGSSALKPKPINLSSPPLSSCPLPPSMPTFYSTTTTTTTTPSPTVLYGMLPPTGVGLPKHALTPLMTLMQPRTLSSASGECKSTPQPLLISPTKPLCLTSLTQGSAAGLTSPSHKDSVSSCASSLFTPDTVQSTQLPIKEASNQVAPQRTLASIPPSEMTPQYAELKAFAEEFKTKRIRLGYTQGAVGQSLSQKGYSNFAQSTISRFEQMQLSATNAAAIKLVLEKWLQETEYPESVSSSSSDMSMMASRKRKKRAVFTPQTKSALDKFFHQNPRPNRQAIDSIAQQLDLRPEEVRVWFCNKRQKHRHTCSSAFSPTSSSFVHLDSPAPSPKRSSPSPKTNFTIEELSKSSTNNNSALNSPVLMTSPLMVSPGNMSVSTTSGLYSLVIPNPTLKPFPQFTIMQTRA